MEERKPFEIQVDDRKYLLELGNCAVVLFRHKQECDYLAIDRGQEETLKAFGAPDMCKYIAGYAITLEGDLIERPYTMMDDKTFRQKHGWNPPVIEKEQPTEQEEQEFIETITRNLDSEWEKGE